MIRDDKAPKILKLTSDSGILNILTDEIAVCKYSDEADIIFNYMTQFDNTDSTKHSTSIENKDRFYVKCSDRFNHLTAFEVYRSEK